MTTISFEQFMGLALYGEGGYYKSEQQKSARRGDYITSVEVGPLFGAVLAKALDGWWEEAGKPSPFYVFDAGAGVGTLGRSILRAEPACLSALKYIMVEQSEFLVSRQADLLEAEPEIFSSRLLNQEINQPVNQSMQKQDALGVENQLDFGIVIANELLDNLPIMLLEKTAPQNPESDPISGESWAEVFVCLEDFADPAFKFLSEKLKPVDPKIAQLAEKLAPAAEVGSRIPITRQATNWLTEAAASLKRGRILVLDYGVLDTAQFALRPQAEWLRTYFGHKSGGSPYENIGRQDITCEVAFNQLNHNQLNHDQLNQAHMPTNHTSSPTNHTSSPASIAEPRIQTQAEFLKEWGILEMLPEIPANSPLPTDLKSIELHSRKVEAEALLEIGGLGSHLAAEWLVGSSAS